MSTFIWPWPQDTEISQTFGTNPGGVNPTGGHTGTDGACPLNTVLRAPCDGVIDYAGYPQTMDGSDNPWLLTAGGGNIIVLNGGDGKPAFVLAHLNTILVKVGQRVKQGDPIAMSGNTGRWTTGPHCHFEALPDGWDITSNTYGRVNPAIYCKGYWSTISAQGSTQEKTVAITDSDLVKLASTLWNTRIQQYNPDKTKLSVQKAAYILGNISQCFSRVLDGQKNIRNDIAALRAEVAALSAKNEATIKNTLASSVIAVDVNVKGNVK